MHYLTNEKVSKGGTVSVLYVVVLPIPTTLQGSMVELKIKVKRRELS